MELQSPSQTPHRYRAIATILLLALVVRLGWVLTRPADGRALDALPDQHDYLSLAQNLLHGRGLQFLDKRFSDTVRAFRTPGYPLFLAACGANIRAARAVQAVLDTSTVLAIYLLAAMIALDRRRGAFPLLAAAIVAVNPYLIYFSGLLLSETLFTAMLAWGMVLLVRGNGSRVASRRSTLLWLCGGLLLALSVLVRPSALFLPVVLGIISVFVNRTGPTAYQKSPLTRAGRRPAHWLLPVGTTMVLLTCLSLLPWVLRNRHVLGRWVWLDTNGGFTLYDGYNPDATGASDQSFVDREPELQMLGEVDRSDYLTQKAALYARTHPARVWDLAGAKLARTWSPMPLSSEYGRPGYRLVALAYSVPFDMLVVLGLVWGGLSRPAKVFVLTPAIYFSIVHALTMGSLRYRIPAEPPMAIMAAGLLVTGPGQARRRV